MGKARAGRSVPPSRIACMRLLTLSGPDAVGAATDDVGPAGRTDAIDALHDLASAFSPHIEPHTQGGDCAVLLEVGDLGRLYTSEHDIVDAMRASARDLDLHIGVAIADNKAVALVRARALSQAAPAAVIPSGWEASALSALPLESLSPSAAMLGRLHSWGLHTVGELARLPRAAAVTRLGQAGLTLHRLACGEGLAPLQPAPPPSEVREDQRLLDAVCDLEPLLFVFRGLLDRVTTRLRARSAACGGLTLQLHLTESVAGKRDVTRRIGVAAPTQKVAPLLDLLRLSFETQPPGAAIERVVLVAQPVDPRPVQMDLFAPAGPAPERLATTIARLQALCGAARIGHPVLPDSHLPGGADLADFSPPASTSAVPTPALEMAAAGGAGEGPQTALCMLASRVLRPAQPATVTCDVAMPTFVQGERFCGAIRRAGGPYRLRADNQTRDYFDVELDGGKLLRLRHDVEPGRWYIDAIYD